MHHFKQMLEKHPRKTQADLEQLVECVGECFSCAKLNLLCADACLNEEMVAELRKCIRLNLDCAEICEVTGRMLSRQTDPDWGVIRKQLETCIVACTICGDECERHARKHEHCKVCAEACRRTEQSCQSFTESLQAGVY